MRYITAINRNSHNRIWLYSCANLPKGFIPWRDTTLHKDLYIMCGATGNRHKAYSDSPITKKEMKAYLRTQCYAVEEHEEIDEFLFVGAL